MKVGILLFEQYHGRANIGSSRIRGHWLSKYWEDAELFKQGKEYDVVIYQKAYWVEHAKMFKGVKILDLCDPDFLHWGYQVKEMIDEVDAVTTSTEKLAEVIRNFTDKPVVCIPDRLDLEEHKQRKFHNGVAQWAVWFGYSTGFDMLKPILHFLKKNKLNLIVISDGLFNIPSNYANYIELQNLPWSIETVNNDIVKGDIVLNPQSTKGKWQFKSNNKTLTSWALGMPVAHNVDELNKFLDPEKRQEESDKRLKEVQEKWDVKLSIQEYKDLIDKIYASNNRFKSRKSS